MAVTKITYTDGGEISTTTAIDGATSGAWASSAIYDNTTNLFVDVLIGGFMDTTATTIAVGDTFDIYLAGSYDTTAATDLGGGTGTGLTASATLTVDTHFIEKNLVFLTSVAVKSASPDAAYELRFGPLSVASAFGGAVPQNFLVVVNNNTGSATGTCKINLVGITYTSA